MQPSVIDTVAKYFYFSCLDERLTYSAAMKALTELRANNLIETENKVEWIRCLTRWRGRLGRLSAKSWGSEKNSPGFSVPSGFDMGAWMTFLTSCENSEVEAVLLSQILCFSDQDIADGLNVSIGTVRYRVGRGLRRLGGFVEY